MQDKVNNGMYEQRNEVKIFG